LESNHERPEETALLELESVLRAIGEEMVALRRRAQVAEARVREMERGGQLPLDAVSSAPPADARVDDLEKENGELRGRLESARDRASELADRLRFLRQQYTDPQGGGERVP
jgi:predicted RNase H-like nuclease (RuvC/YqgF family)